MNCDIHAEIDNPSRRAACSARNAAVDSNVTDIFVVAMRGAYHFIASTGRPSEDPYVRLVNTASDGRISPRPRARSRTTEPNRTSAPGPEGQLMTTISTEDPIAVAVMAAITGDLTTLRRLLVENPGWPRRGSATIPEVVARSTALGHGSITRPDRDGDTHDEA